MDQRPSSFGFYKGLYIFKRWYHKKQQNQPLKIKSEGGVVSTPPRPSAGIIRPAKVGLKTVEWELGGQETSQAPLECLKDK